MGTTSPRALTDPTAASANLPHSTRQCIRRLHRARAEVKAEVQRCTHNAPVFSGDGRIALIRISSAAQVHPVSLVWCSTSGVVLAVTCLRRCQLIATRWAATLKSARLEMVMCANDSYLREQGMTNFACRVARCATSRADGAQTSELGKRHNMTNNADINVIAMLESYTVQAPGLRDAMGDNFARGHKQVRVSIRSSVVTLVQIA